MTGTTDSADYTDNDAALDDMIGNELLVELERLVAEARDRIRDGHHLAAIASVQAAASRCEDVANWSSRLLSRSARRCLPNGAPSGNGAYL